MANQPARTLLSSAGITDRGPGKIVGLTQQDGRVEVSELTTRFQVVAEATISQIDALGTIVLQS